MLGFHSDGIRLYGASDTLQAQLKKRKLPISTKISGNTLVFAIDDFEIVKNAPIIFLLPQIPHLGLSAHYKKIVSHNFH